MIRRAREITIGIGTLFFMAVPADAAVAQTITYVHTDALGSPIAETDSNGGVARISEYSPYGDLLNRPVSDSPGYSGHIEDLATGLVYMQQRYYDPKIGLFLSADPVQAYSHPVVMFNRYRYANNNPYRFKDPDGRKCTTTNGEASCTFDEFTNNKGKSISREEALSGGSRLARALGIDRGSRILRAEAAMTSKYVAAQRLAASGGQVTIRGDKSLGIPAQSISGSTIVSRMESTRTIANAGTNPTNFESVASVKVTVSGAPPGEPINFWRDGGSSPGKAFGHEILHTAYSGVGLENKGWANGDYNYQHQAPFDEGSDEIR